MKIIPVLDIQGGVVVRGIAGRRSEYRPIVSKLTSSVFPVDVAEAFRTHFKLAELYIADLDGITGGEPDIGLYTVLQARGFCPYVDAGVRDTGRAQVLADAGVNSIVLGLETTHGPELISDCRLRLGATRLIFSLDLKAGKPLGDLSGWGSAEPFDIAEEAMACGIHRLIVLDLERVGVGEGTGTEELCRRLSASHPDVQLIAGGGIRNQADINRLADCGVDAVLVASALHDGRLTPA
jgi:phosphoribosylformimino-5-aminoimidazole carboxamide ribotide isomerase